MEINILATSYISKSIKYFVNNFYRKKVELCEGSVVFTDFGDAGIYIGNNEIITISVDSLLNEISEVKKITLKEFLGNSKFPESFYISSNENGSIGNKNIVEYAKNKIGEKNNFGLIYKNSYSFVKKCLDYSNEDFFQIGEDVEEKKYSEIGLLKQKVKNKIGATKWFLYNVENFVEKNKDIFYNVEKNVENFEKNNENLEKEKFRELKIGETIKKYEEMPLNDEIIEHLEKELTEMWDFFREISDENIPNHVMKIVIKIIKVLEQMIFMYEENENRIKGLGGDFTHKELREMGDDFKHIVDEMGRNKGIKDVLKKLGKGQYEADDKKENKVAKTNKNEIFGINKSNDLARMLSSELVNLEDENLKYLFYAKYLENNLMTYEIKGENEFEKDEIKDKITNKGPIVVCLDTSGSMKGNPLQRAKALVLAIVKILQKENRNLHIIIFGAKEQYEEFEVNIEREIVETIKFLKKGYDGGTDFETPLKRAMELIENSGEYKKADILMVTDGACKLSFTFKKKIREEKERLNFKIYTVICGADRIERDFSDSVLVI